MDNASQNTGFEGLRIPSTQPMNGSESRNDDEGDEVFREHLLNVTSAATAAAAVANKRSESIKLKHNDMNAESHYGIASLAAAAARKRSESIGNTASNQSSDDSISYPLPGSYAVF